MQLKRGLNCLFPNHSVWVHVNRHFFHIRPLCVRKYVHREWNVAAEWWGWEQLAVFDWRCTDAKFSSVYVGLLDMSCVPTGFPSRGGDVAVEVFDINKPSLPTSFYSVLVSISFFMALSTVFHSTNSPNNSRLSHSVLPVLFLPYWPFQLYFYLWKSHSALI